MNAGLEREHIHQSGTNTNIRKKHLKVGHPLHFGWLSGRMHDPTYPTSTSPASTTEHRPVFVNITHHGKFVRRIFNNGTYHSWWQRIDGKATVEIDYSSLRYVIDGGG